ncbi:hypothetical protein GY45DRAFT_483634 [Cubamyces sp. BRFM 1775]|nr:hypothetical protein GY45DRAFT_483634 [Cubamyces sp. BRFM 1775]
MTPRLRSARRRCREHPTDALLHNVLLTLFLLSFATSAVDTQGNSFSILCLFAVLKTQWHTYLKIICRSMESEAGSRMSAMYWNDCLNFLSYTSRPRHKRHRKSPCPTRLNPKLDFRIFPFKGPEQPFELHSPTGRG